LGKMLHCSGRRGVIVSFAWPARQSMFLYGGDVERGRASAHFLADLIEQVAANTKAENINVLAYSAGAACATDALLELRKRHQDQTPEQLAKSLRIGYVIYAASDLDLETFAREQIVQLKQLAQAVVIYVSDDDMMLGMASVFYGASRVGHPDTTKFTKAEQEAVAKDPQIQVVDVTDVPDTPGFGGLGHYYWYANDWVMTDVLVNFRWQISPDQRGLYHKPGMSRWYFPKDYPDKVTAAVKQMTMPTTAPANPFGASTVPTTAFDRPAPP
jgi:esterase/lipase superfamily enzyme